MEPQVKPKSALLYDTDYQLWLNDTVAQLKARNFNLVDLEHLIEELESLGRSDKRSISSYLLRLCEHLLKLKYWESERERCCRGWILEINNFRAEIELIFKDSPSLKPFFREAFLASYQKARKNLLKVIDISADFIPQEPDFTLEQALDEDWFPWQPESTL